MTNILVTGATGFIGATLGPALRKRGHTLSGTTRKADLGNGPGGIPLSRVDDLGRECDWTRALAGAEVVVHLAARVHVMREDAADPDAAFRRANTEGTEHLARQAAQAGVRRFVYLSSAKVMGEETAAAAAFSEADPPAPEDAYGASKWAAEQALAEIAGACGLEVVVLRPPLVYGPGVRGNFLKLLAACQRRLPLPLGGLDNRRSLVFAGNLADAIIAAIENPAAAGETFFVDDGEAVSTPGLIRQISAALGVEDRLWRAPPVMLRLAGGLAGKRDAVRRLTGSLVIDSAKIRRRLAWTPPFDLSSGLHVTAAWYLENRRES